MLSKTNIITYTYEVSIFAKILRKEIFLGKFTTKQSQFFSLSFQKDSKTEKSKEIQENIYSLLDITRNKLELKNQQ